jgi:hypothetical protein
MLPSSSAGCLEDGGKVEETGVEFPEDLSSDGSDIFFDAVEQLNVRCHNGAPALLINMAIATNVALGRTYPV